MVYAYSALNGYQTFHFGVDVDNVGTVDGYYLKNITDRSFQIFNDFDVSTSFYWIAIGPATIFGNHSPYPPGEGT